MEVLGIGTDIVTVLRVERAVANTHFLRKCFTDGEVEYCRGKGVAAMRSFAGFFAAKEAVAKALGGGFVGFLPRDIEILHNASGKPFVRLSSNVDAPQDCVVHLSISHERDFAVAMAVVCKG
ncbi:MAG: holo-ACP synthase [Defluviitaleaceae bacterium]|nr:holo-ACP synthase [Defluviitaleaceae bacterium]